MDEPFQPELVTLLAVTVIVYTVAMFALALWAQSKVKNHEDFIVAGRRLPLSLAWMTLLATWFGAGTMLHATDRVRERGVEGAAMDPLGAGLCLLFAGLLIAAPLWRMGLLTLPDFFRRKFGPTAELLASAIMVPSYFGWIAAQFVALAEMLHLFFGIPLEFGIALVALVGTGYTLMGGMWSVTLTDAVQIILVLVGLVVIGVVVLMQLGDGLASAGLDRLFSETPPDRIEVFPTEPLHKFWTWIGLLTVGALGNVPGQDLMQRIFAAKSASVARSACFVAGGVYLLFGLIPVGLGLSAALLIPDVEQAILPALAGQLLNPLVAVIFTLALMSAVLSTIDSAIMAPSSVLAQNIFSRFSRWDALVLNRLAVVLVAAGSLGMAYWGKTAFDLLEDAYTMTLVGLFVPLMLGIYSQPRSPWPCIAAMLTGCGAWLIHLAFEAETFLAFVPGLEDSLLPESLGCTLMAGVVYFLFEPPWRLRRADPHVPLVATHIEKA